MYTKYKYWSSTHCFKKYLSTSSTFISSTSTSTSTHIKICFKGMIDIQSRVNFGWTKQKGFPQITSLLNSQDGAVANVADSDRCRCNPKVPSSIPAGGKDFP